MSAIEEGIYVRMARSFVVGFCEFISDIDKREVVLSDEDLLSNLQKVVPMLHRVIDRWNDSGNNSTLKSECSSSCNILDLEPSAMNNLEKSLSTSREEENKSSATGKCKRKMANHPKFVEKIYKVVRQHCKYSSDELSDNSCDGDISENVAASETLIGGLKKSKLDCSTLSGDGSIENEDEITLITEDVYSCNICSISSLLKNNLHSHINGKQHKNNRKLRENKQQTQNTSVTRLNTDIDLILKDLDPSLSRDTNGNPFISMGSCYFCHLCNIELTSESNLKQHVNGSKHRARMVKTGSLIIK